MEKSEINKKKRFDIRITNISTQYGNAKTTRIKLKAVVLKEMLNQNIIEKYGFLKSFRIPYSQEKKLPETYYGFISMADTSVHTDVLEKLKEMKIRFGNEILGFEQASSCRIPWPTNKRKAEDEEAEDHEDDVIFLGGGPWTRKEAE